jgi:hypothetical protein
MGDQGLTGAAVPGDDVDHTGRQPDLGTQLGKAQRGERRELGRLEYYRVTHGQRGRDLPGQHEQREVPGDDLADHADGLAPGQLALHELGPAGVMIEMPGNERDVDVAGLPDRLSVVESLQYCKQSAVLLNLAGKSVEIACAPVAAQCPPVRLCLSGGFHGTVDLGWTRLSQRRERLGGGGVESFEGLTAGLGPISGDEEPESAAMSLQPLQCRRGSLRRRSVLHRFENLGN